jgi:hypothetical protein
MAASFRRAARHKVVNRGSQAAIAAERHGRLRRTGSERKARDGQFGKPAHAAFNLGADPSPFPVALWAVHAAVEDRCVGSKSKARALTTRTSRRRNLQRCLRSAVAANSSGFARAAPPQRQRGGLGSRAARPSGPRTGMTSCRRVRVQGRDPCWDRRRDARFPHPANSKTPQFVSITCVAT